VIDTGAIQCTNKCNDEMTDAKISRSTDGIGIVS
jgi:hypothetical protein